MIGFVNELKQINHRSSWNSNNAVCYYGYNGYKCPSNQYEGSGFREG
jgi:hypothetical protein